MVWAILALLGVPLWLCAAGILMIVMNNRKLRKRYGDVPVRVKRPGKKRWTRGHAIWVSDVFAWRGSPAAWNEDLVHVVDVRLRSPDADEAHQLRHMGEDVSIATLLNSNDQPVEVAAVPTQQAALLGPFQAGAA